MHSGTLRLNFWDTGLMDHQELQEPVHLDAWIRNVMSFLASCTLT